MKSGLMQPKGDQLTRSINENFEETYIQPATEDKITNADCQEETMRLILQHLVEQGYAEIAELLEQKSGV